MRLILLRHQERFEDPTLLTELTDIGKQNANSSIEKLSKYPISKIYCSPFIRTLQTIDPFSRHSSIPICVENGLYECTGENIFNPSNYYRMDSTIYTQIIQDEFNIDSSYVSIIKEPINILEKELDLMKRVKVLLDHVVEPSDKMVLMVAHQSTLNAIIKHYIPNHDIDYPYKIGGIWELRINNDGKLLESITTI